MTATNHAITGAIIGLSLGNPYAAVPLSLASHYFMDTLPHFGNKWDIKSSEFVKYLFVEGFLCFLIVLTLFLTKPHNYILGMVCAFVGAFPDLLSFKFFRTTRKNKVYKAGVYFKFAKGIQKKESAENIKYDIAWFFVALILFMFLISRS